MVSQHRSLPYMRDCAWVGLHFFPFYSTRWRAVITPFSFFFPNKKTIQLCTQCLHNSNRPNLPKPICLLTPLMNAIRVKELLVRPVLQAGLQSAASPQKNNVSVMACFWSYVTVNCALRKFIWFSVGGLCETMPNSKCYFWDTDVWKMEAQYSKLLNKVFLIV